MEEDKAAAPFVGPAGEILSAVYIDAMGLHNHADIYATNVIRCKPPTPDYKCKAKEYKACRSYLDQDIAALSELYGTGNLIVVGLGAGTAKALCKTSLENMSFLQGYPQTFGTLSIPTFWTDNPANLFPQNNPSRVTVVEDHLRLVEAWAVTGELPEIETQPEWTKADAPVGEIDSGILSIDIESYGARSGLPNQRVFNAQRAIQTDSCPPDQLCQTVSVCYRSNRTLVAHAWDISRPDQMRSFESFIRRLDRKRSSLLGMNTQFDLGFLVTDTKTKDIDWRSFLVRDLGVTNYLHSEMRPERSLKNLSPLLGTADYTEEVNLKKGQRYSPEQTAELLTYNVKDAFATLRNYEILVARIKEDYGEDTDKLSDYTTQFYSDLIWFAVEEGLNGFCLDRARVERLDKQAQDNVAKCVRLVKQKYGGSLVGKGSNTYKEKLAQEALIAAGLANDKRVKRTKEKKRISRANENLELALGNLPRQHTLAKQINILQAFTVWQGMHSRYTKPMLVGRKEKGKKELSPASLLLGDMVYPTWYLVPSAFEDYSKGGTKQGRIVCLRKGTSVITSEGDLPIEEAVQRKLEVLTFSPETGKFWFTLPSKWIDGGTQPLLKITYKGRNSVGEVYCSPEHRWLRKNGKFVRANELKKGDSLRHLYRYTDHHGYPRIRSRDRKWPQRMESLHVLNLPGHEVVHHTDENRANFRRSNLQGMNSATHISLHHTGKGSPPVTYTCENCGNERTIGASRDYQHRFCCYNCWREFRKNNYRVLSVEKAGKGRVYCFEVPGTETFVLSDGLVSGNCRNPGLQNPAKPVKKCFYTRWDDGVLLEGDLSQIELRVAALVSGDPLMIDDYVRADGDRHLSTAILILQEILAYFTQRGVSGAFGLTRDWVEHTLASNPTKKTPGMDRWRQLGKTLNFLTLFRGGAKKAQETAARDNGLLLPLDVWKKIVGGFYAKHPVFAAWQNGWINEVITKGVAVLPVLGQSRMFLGGRPSLDTAINEIANCPIQTLAADAMLDAVRAMRRELREKSMRTTVSNIIYDAMYPDCPREEVTEVRSMMKRHLSDIDFWHRLEAYYGHTVPVKGDIKVFAYKGETPC